MKACPRLLLCHLGTRAKWLIRTWFFLYPQELWISLWMCRGEGAFMPVKTALVTRCSTFDQLKIVIYISSLQDCFGFVAASLTDRARAYVNTLTLCKTALLCLEK